MITASWNIKGLFKADAEKVAEEIMQIQSDAGVTPAQIVEAAKEGTELYKCFEWRNDIAAEKYRIQQARQIMCNLIIVHVDKNHEEQPKYRVFYKTKLFEGYKPTKMILQKPDERKALVMQALREFEAFKTKYACIKDEQQMRKFFEM